MKNFINTFKAKAHSKELTCADMIALCIYRTMKAKSEDKAIILTHFLKKTFTAGKVCAHRQYPYQSITTGMYYLNGQLRPRKRWSPEGWYETNGELLGEKITDLLTAEEEQVFRELASMVYNQAFVKAL
jgi:hypothetical protein